MKEKKYTRRAASLGEVLGWIVNITSFLLPGRFGILKSRVILCFTLR
jgi:hypothetical protein